MSKSAKQWIEEHGGTVCPDDAVIPMVACPNDHKPHPGDIRLTIFSSVPLPTAIPSKDFVYQLFLTAWDGFAASPPIEEK